MYLTPAHNTIQMTWPDNIQVHESQDRAAFLVPEWTKRQFWLLISSIAPQTAATIRGKTACFTRTRIDNWDIQQRIHYVERLPESMIRGLGASELRMEKKISHQRRQVAKIPVAPPITAQQRGTAKPQGTRRGTEIWPEQITLWPIVMRIRGRNVITGKAYSTNSLSYSVSVTCCFPPPPSAHGAALPSPPAPPQIKTGPPPHFPNPNFSAREVLISSSSPV